MSEGGEEVVIEACHGVVLEFEFGEVVEVFGVEWFLLEDTCEECFGVK